MVKPITSDLRGATGGSQASSGTVRVTRRPRWSWALGYPCRLELEETVDETIPRDEHDDLVAAIERFMRLEGTTSERPGGLVWKCGGRIGQTVVEVMPWRGGTKVRAVGRYWDTLAWMFAGATMIGWMPGLLVVAGLELGPKPGAIALIVSYVVAYLGVRTIWHSMGREQEHGLSALLARVVEYARGSDEALGAVGQSDTERRVTLRRPFTTPDTVAKRNAQVVTDRPSPHVGDQVANEL